MNEDIHAGHRQRMENRFMQTGLEGFSPHEVLEFLLFYTYSRKDTNPIGHALINEFGTLQNVFSQTPESLMRVKGVGKRSAILIKFVSEIIQAYQNIPVSNTYRKWNFDNRHKFFIKKFEKETANEVFMVACLDDTGTIISSSRLESGTSKQVKVDLYKLVDCIVRSHSTAVILAHNHPIGAAFPSSEDFHETQTISNFLSQLHIDLLDHIIVSGNSFYSMREFDCTGCFH